MNSQDRIEWMRTHNVQEALRVAVEDLKPTDYTPFEDLVSQDGVANIMVTLENGKITFSKGPSIKPSKPEVFTRPTVEIKTEEPVTTTEDESIKPRKIRKV